MSKPGLSMPLNWGDLLADTLHLTRGEFGAYMLLIGAYWCNGGPLPDQDVYLRNVARCEPGEWATARPTLAKFFTVKDGTWTHKRVEAELARLHDLKTRQRQRTAAATAARAKPRNVTKHVTEEATPAAAQTVTPNVTERGNPAQVEPRAPGPLRKPADLNDCLAMGQRIGLADQDARDWYRDCEAAQWRRGDGTLFDNWPRQMSLHRDILREKRSRTTARPGSGPAQANPAAELILRQNELKRVEERMRVIKSSYEAHSTWDEDDRKEFAKLRDRKKELISLLGMSV